MKLINHIDAIRFAKHMSVEDVALESDIKPSSLSKIKNNISNPTLITAFNIAKTLNTPIEKVFEVIEWQSWLI